jgi:hypothetical protein
MKILILITTLLLSSLGWSQYPIIDDFNSVGGVNEWYNATGNVNMCVESGTLLCYNCGVNYNDNQWYSWQSQDYMTKFSDDGCDDISIIFYISYFVRNTDDVQLWWYNGGWFGISLVSALNTTMFNGTITLTLPSTTSYFSFDLATGNSGNKSSKFVHVDYFTIDCIYSLPIELIVFDCEVSNGSDVELYWSTSSQVNNDYFILEHSIDGYNWETIKNINGAGNSSQVINYSVSHINAPDGINYYRLTQYDFDGKSETFNIVSCNKDICNKEIKRIIYYNNIGQEIGKPINGYYLEVIEYIDESININKRFILKD